MRILVVGAGGVGGYFGARLAAAGHQVAFLARGAHLQAMQQNGLQVNSILGDLHVQPVTAQDSVTDLPRQDLILFACKSFQLIAAAEQVRSLVSSETLLLPLLNGVEAPEQLLSLYPSSQVLGGLCKIISYIEAPGVVRHAGATPIIQFGEWSGEDSERGRQLQASFERASIKTTFSTQIQGLMWEKFLFISAVSGMGAITDQAIGAIREDMECRELLTQAMQETINIANARQIPIAEDALERTLRFVDALPADSTASMQRDLAEGKASELDAQVGAVVRMGAELGIATPVNHFIYHCLRLRAG